MADGGAGGHFSAIGVLVGRRWLSLRRAAVVVLAVSLGVGLAGCGQEDGGSGSDKRLPTSEPTVVAAGCTEDYPEEGDILSPELVGVVTICKTPGGHHALLTNVSSWILSIQPRPGTTIDRFNYPLSSSAVDVQAANSIADANTTATAIGLPPSGNVVATNPVDIAHLVVNLKFATAAEAYVVATLGSYIEGRLRTPGQRYAQSLALCAAEVGRTWGSPTTPDAAPLSGLLVSNVLSAGFTCNSLLKQVASETGDDIPPPQTLQREFTKLGAHFKTTAVTDLRNLVLRIVATR